MLNAMRDGAKSGIMKFILLGFMVMAVGGLVLTDVGGFFRGGISTNLVAKGDGIKIATVEFDRNVRRILSRQSMSPNEAFHLGMIHQILRGEIQNRILIKEVHKLGLVVDDDTVAAQISKLAEPLAQNGVSKSDALKQLLRSQGISEGEFIASIRQEMATGLLKNALMSGAGSINQAQAKDIYQFQNESRDLEGFVLNDSDVKDINQPSDEKLQNYYDATKANYLIAERRDITIATLKKEMIADKVNITDEDLRDVYADNIETYQKPEQRQLQQAVLTSQADADAVAEKAKSGTDLKQAVKEVTGGTNPYLGENNFTESGLLPNIATPVFDAQKGDVVGSVQSPLGFHVLVLKDILEPQTESFDKVKAALRDNMMQERLLDDLIDAANTLDDQLAGGAPLDEVVKEMGLTTESFANLNMAGMDKNDKDTLSSYDGDKAQILDVAFDYEEGESSPVMELADGRYITVHVDKVTQRSYTPFEEVKKELSKKWIGEERRLSNQARAEDIFTKIKAGTSLADAAKEVGVSLKTFENIKRNEKVESPLTFNALRDIFEAKEGIALKIKNPEGFVIAKVTSIALPETNTADAEKEIGNIEKQASDSMSQEMMAQYISALAEDYDIKINDQVLQNIYGDTEQN